MVFATARGAPARMPAHRPATVLELGGGDGVRDESDLEGERGVEGLAREERRREPRAAGPAQDRHGDDRRGHADAHLGEGEREVSDDDDEVARRHQPDATGRAGPHSTAIVGTSASISRFRTGHERARVGWSGATLLEVGTGAERRRDVGQHDRSIEPSTAPASAASSAGVEVAHQAAGQGVAIGRGVEA